LRERERGSKPQVVPPETIKGNILDTLERHREVARAYRKVIRHPGFKGFDDAARSEIRIAIEGLFRRWNLFRSTLDVGGRGSAALPVKHDERIIAPELGERVGRLADKLIKLDRKLARELADLILQRGVAERLWADLDTGIDIEERAF